MPSDEYVRVYLSIRTDPKFVTVYGDDRHLACWLRLLMEADAVWPNAVPVPRRVRQASLAELVRVGLIELLPNDQYRVHGLDSERNRRSEAGRNAAKARWNDARKPRRDAGAMRPHSRGNADPMHATQRSTNVLRVAMPSAGVVDGPPLGFKEAMSAHGLDLEAIGKSPTRPRRRQQPVGG